MFRLTDNYYVIQTKLPSPGLQVEVILVDYDGSKPPKQKPADVSADKKSNDDSYTSISAKASSSPPVEPNKEAGSDDDKDDAKMGHPKVSSSGQGAANAAIASETSCCTEGAISCCWWNREHNSMSEFKAIAADAPSVFSFEEEDAYESK